MKTGTTPIEKRKAKKEPLAIIDDLPRFAEDGLEKIPEEDRDVLKWIGVFLRKRTPGFFMMRIRIPNGQATSAQLRALAEIESRLGNGILDVTTRQQIELRSIRINDVPEILERLRGIDLSSLQTGMDNIRNINSCPLAGLTPHELFDATPVGLAFQKIFLGNVEYTNLPRKANVTITGCLENCTHVESQDIGMAPAIRRTQIGDVQGFNVFVGGKMGSGGFRVASDLNIFVAPEDAPSLCGEILKLFRDEGERTSRTRARLAFLVDDWGVEKFRAALMERCKVEFLEAGEDVRYPNRHADHLGITPQKQDGFVCVGLCIPVGRVNSEQLVELARLADEYGRGEVRLTTSQNAILPWIPKEKLPALLKEPLLQVFQPEPLPVYRGLVSCVGIDYCNLAVIETKGISMKIAKKIEGLIPPGVSVTMNWSGCPAGCGNHQASDIGFLGTKVSIDGKPTDAAHIFVGGRTGPGARPGVKVMDYVPVDLIPEILPTLFKHLDLLKKIEPEENGKGRVVMVPVNSEQQEVS